MGKVSLDFPKKMGKVSLDFRNLHNWLLRFMSNRKSKPLSVIVVYDIINSFFTDM